MYLEKYQDFHQRGIYISIDLMLETPLISKTPYKMSTLELKELQMQVEELLKKGYIHSSVSSWGVPIIFVKKNDAI